MTSHVISEIDGPIGLVTLNNPDKHNAFDDVLIADLTAALQALDVGSLGFVELRDLQLSRVAANTQQPHGDGEGPSNPPLPEAVVRAVQGGASRGTVQTADGLTVSFERLPQVPLLVMVGLHGDETMAGWRSEAAAMAAGTAVFLLVYAAALAWAWRATQQTRRARQHADRLAVVFERTGESIALFDAAYRIVEVNPAFEAQTGYGAQELLGRSAEFLCAPRASGPAHAALWAQLQAQGRWSGEVWHRSKSGREYLVWLSVSSVPEDAHPDFRYIGSAIDITDAGTGVHTLRNRAGSADRHVRNDVQ